MSETGWMRARLKPLAARAAGDYEIYWIVGWDAGPTLAPQLPEETDCAVASVDADGIARLRSPLLKEQGWYAGTQARAFLATWRGEPAGLCFYWYGARYRARNFWPLKSDEAKLVQVVVDPPRRGLGIATALIARSASVLAQDGFARLYARVWHSNAASLRAFQRAGWRRTALVVTAAPFGFARRARLVLPWRRL